MTDLSRHQVGTSMARVLAYLRMTTEETNQYLFSVWETANKWPPEQFDQVCQHLCSTMEPNRKPAPKKFREAYLFLAKRNAWNQSKAPVITQEKHETLLDAMVDTMSPAQARLILQTRKDLMPAALQEKLRIKVTSAGLKPDDEPVDAEFSVGEDKDMKPEGTF